MHSRMIRSNERGRSTRCEGGIGTPESVDSIQSAPGSKGVAPKWQGIGIRIPYQLLLAMPYVVAIIVLALRRRHSGAPERLGEPYIRG